MAENLTTPTAPRDILAMPVDQLTYAERREILFEAESFLISNTPPRNNPGLEESTTVFVSPRASKEVKLKAEEIQKLETERLEKARAWFDKQKNRPELLDATADRLLERIIVMLGLQNGEGTIDFRLFGDPKVVNADFFLAHEGIDQDSKTDAIAVIQGGVLLILRIDAATGSAIPKMAQNFISLRESGDMGSVPTVTLKLLPPSPTLRGADVGKAPRFITALSRSTVLRLAQKFVRLNRAINESVGARRIGQIEDDIESDESNLWIIEQLAIQAIVYRDYAEKLYNEALHEKEGFDLLLKNPAGVSPDALEVARNELSRLKGVVADKSKKIEAAPGFIEKISDTKFAMVHIADMLQVAYKEKHKAIVMLRERRGLPPIDDLPAEDLSHRRLMQILETPELVAEVASLTKDQLKRQRQSR